MKTLYCFSIFIILSILVSSHAYSVSLTNNQIYDAKFFFDNSKPLKVGDTVDCFVYFCSRRQYNLFITSKNKNITFIENHYTNDALDSMSVFEYINDNIERAIYFSFI